MSKNSNWKITRTPFTQIESQQKGGERKWKRKKNNYVHNKLSRKIHSTLFHFF